MFAAIYNAGEYFSPFSPQSPSPFRRSCPFPPFRDKLICKSLQISPRRQLRGYRIDTLASKYFDYCFGLHLLNFNRLGTTISVAGASVKAYEVLLVIR